MSNLYEKINPGDRRTVVKKFPQGTNLRYADGSVIMLKSHVATKVTQEFDPSMGRGEWVDKTYDLPSMVEIDSPYERPPPTAMPGLADCGHIAAMATDGPCPVCMPRAEIRRPWWRFW